MIIDRLKAYSLYLNSIFLCSGVFASDVVHIEQLKGQVVSANLAHSVYWKKLVHYKPSGLFDRRWHSDVITPGFFISSSGPADPVAELEATIEAYLADDSYADGTVRCKYVARYKWLEKQIDLPRYEPERCEKYQSWSQQGQVESLSMVFATGYLDNPASFYGHILLKFNNSNTVAQTDLLNYSLNFGAIVPDGENPLAYMLKGIFGGYDAVFSHQKFYRHHHSYGEVELRDLWEYELDLTAEEVAQVVDHSWELFGSAFVYRFVDHNCAYQMSELLSLVTETPLVPEQSPWSLPYTVFDGLAKAEIRGRPLLSRIERLPSKQARFHDRFEALTERQQMLVGQLVEEEILLSDDAFSSLPVKDRIQVTEVLMAYYDFRLVSEQSDPLKQRYQQLLLERIRLPSTSVQWPAAGSRFPPHMGQKPSMVRLSRLHNSALGDGYKLTFRPAYYDHLSLDAGRLPHSRLSMLETEIVVNQSGTVLRKLDLVNIETLNLSGTGLPGDGGMAWKLRFGFDNPDLSCDNCNVFSVNGGVGKGVELTNWLVGYGFLEGRLQSRDRFDRSLAVTSRVGFITSEKQGWKALLNLGFQQYLNGSRTEEPVVDLVVRYGADRDWDIRFGYQRNKAEEVSATLSYYW